MFEFIKPIKAHPVIAGVGGAVTFIASVIAIWMGFSWYQDQAKTAAPSDVQGKWLVISYCSGNEENIHRQRRRRADETGDDVKVLSLNDFPVLNQTDKNCLYHGAYADSPSARYHLRDLIDSHSLGSAYVLNVTTGETFNLTSASIRVSNQATPLPAPDEIKRLSTERLSSEKLQSLDASTLLIWRNAIFAVHGKRFDSEVLRAYFTAQNWYKTRADYSARMLTSVEKYNVQKIVLEERRRTAPAEIRQLSARVLAPEELVRLNTDTLNAWLNSIYAVHGREIRNRDLIGAFKPWYQRSAYYSDNDRTEIERRNTDIIAAELKRRGAR